MRRMIMCIAGVLVLTFSTAVLADPPQVPQKPDPSTPEKKDAEAPKPSFNTLPIWEGGLAEISYYRATDRIYDQERSYTRVHMVNRQWMDQQTAVRADPGEGQVVPVLKLNISEEIPTENYNYHFMTTVFLNQLSLSCFKLAASSQDWNGTTFKQLRWDQKGPALRSYSYLKGEGDRVTRLGGTPMPYEALFLLVRDVVARGKMRNYHLLQPMRTIHVANPRSTRATLVLEDVSPVTVPAGTYAARHVKVQWEGPATEFVVEAAPPYRLLRYDAGDTHGELLHVEHRAYWDRTSKSRFYKPGEAP